MFTSLIPARITKTAPYKGNRIAVGKDRQRVRSLVGADDFIEIYCRCPLEVCEDRDIKGLYRQARSGKIKEFTGISSPYEVPEKPELVLDTNVCSLDECVSKVMALLSQRGIIRK